jgi:hypothetical protein
MRQRLLEFFGLHRDETILSDPEALEAYKNYLPFEHIDTTPTEPDKFSELRLFELYRDYMKHEDSLLTSRLGTFLTMNTFMIGASVVILGGILQLLTKSDLQPERMALLVAIGTFVHSMIAVIGGRSAELTRISINAATQSLAFLRDKGNHRLRAAITRGDLPYLTNGRGLSKSEREKLDRGSGIMRGIPAMMKWMWILFGLIPAPIVVAVFYAQAECPRWNASPPTPGSNVASYWNRVLCTSDKAPSVHKLRLHTGSVIEITT